MATKKFLMLQDFSDEELMNDLKETEAQFQQMKFDHAIKGLDNPLTLREVRRNIARLRTEIRRRELARMSAEEISGRSRIRNRRKRKK